MKRLRTPAELRARHLKPAPCSLGRHPASDPLHCLDRQCPSLDIAGDVARHDRLQSEANHEIRRVRARRLQAGPVLRVRHDLHDFIDRRHPPTVPVGEAAGKAPAAEAVT